MFSSLGLFSSFFLGCLHAVEPGHGKTAIVGYLIGQRGSILPAIALGLGNSLAHGVTIFFLALGVNSGAAFLGLRDSDHSIKFLEFISGVSIIALSLYLLFREMVLRNANECCETPKVGLSDLARVDSLWKQMRFSFFMGITGGLVPCGTAFATYLANVSDGHFERGILSVLLFSLGVFLSVTLSTWLVLRSTHVMNFFKIQGLERRLHWVRFIIMFGTGLYLLVH